jgi:hypothetical protein
LGLTAPLLRKRAIVVVASARKDFGGETFTGLRKSAFASVRHGLIGFNVRIVRDIVCGCMDATSKTLHTPLAAPAYNRRTVRRRYVVDMKTPLILTALGAMVALTPLSAQETIVRETTTAVQPTEIVGTVAELVPDAVVLRTQEATAPVRYTFTKTTEYVDELGNRVTRESIKTGCQSRSVT